MKSPYFTGFFGALPHFMQFFINLFRYPFDFMQVQHKKTRISAKRCRFLYPSTRFMPIFSACLQYTLYIFTIQYQHKVCARLLFIVQKSQYLCGFWDALQGLLREADKIFILYMQLFFKKYCFVLFFIVQWTCPKGDTISSFGRTDGSRSPKPKPKPEAP